MARGSPTTSRGHRGYGPGAYGVLLALRGGAPWDEPAAKLFGGQGSFGNGAARRVAPVGALFHDNLPRLRRVAEQQATITHTHVLGTQGRHSPDRRRCRRDAVRPDTGGQLRRASLFGRGNGNRRPVGAVVRRGHNDIGRLLPTRPPGKTVVEVLGNGIEAHEAVPAAIYAFLAHPDSFEEAVTYAVRLGGDADTIGAMTGAIAGAYHGAAAIPERWLAALENGPKGRDYVRDLADRLFATWQQQQRGRVA
jgi:poly(ADP-ribose) glycohydrolase ARH3